MLIPYDSSDINRPAYLIKRDSYGSVGERIEGWGMGRDSSVLGKVTTCRFRISGPGGLPNFFPTFFPHFFSPIFIGLLNLLADSIWLGPPGRATNWHFLTNEGVHPGS